jgi:DNA-directed RNA polymerase subunit L
MFIRILKETSDELRIEIEGEGHTFCNPLQKILLEDEEVEVAGYDIPHPLFNNTILYIHTKGERKPKTALREALNKLRERSDDFKSAFEKTLKKE